MFAINARNNHRNWMAKRTVIWCALNNIHETDNCWGFYLLDERKIALMLKLRGYYREPKPDWHRFCHHRHDGSKVSTHTTKVKPTKEQHKHTQHQHIRTKFHKLNSIGVRACLRVLHHLHKRTSASHSELAEQPETLNSNQNKRSNINRKPPCRRYRISKCV